MNRAPRLNKTEKIPFLETHLGNEIQWVLRSTAEWYVQDTLKLEVPGYEVQVFAMDSCFLHSRSLFEFFTRDNSKNHYDCKMFGVRMGKSRLYDEWEDPLHSYLMHLQYRFCPTKLTTKNGSQKDLNELPLEFAREIVRLWREFESSLLCIGSGKLLSKRASEILDLAIKNSEKVQLSKVYDDCPKLKDRKDIKLIKWE